MERSNENWVSSLKSGDSLIKDKAISELHAILVRGLYGAFQGNTNATQTIIEDAAQDTLLKVTTNIDSFRGESMFLTWAMKIAIRTVYSEMRRNSWKDISLTEASDIDRPLIENIASDSFTPDEISQQNQILEHLWQAINESLTEKQKTALIADFVGKMPIEEIAIKMGSNRNAVYKLLYDARQNLQKHLISSDINFGDVQKAFDI